MADQSPWNYRTVRGFSLASFFSDASHEMATAVLPLYLQHLGLGASVLGWVEGLSDVFASAAKYWAGVAGQRMDRRKGWVALGYLATTLCVGAFAFAASAVPFVVLRTVAWIGRGFRGPLRDALLAEAVDPSAYGKAYGLERAGDMAGAVAGPLLAALLLGLSFDLPAVFLITVIPGLLAVLSVLLLVEERGSRKRGRARLSRPPLPLPFWLFLGAVFLFGLGDYSRTFLIFEAARRLPPGGGLLLSVPVLLYVFHNAVSGLFTVPAGHLADRASPGFALLLGYGLGVLFNLGMAFLPGWLGLLVPLFLLSGVYIAVEETVEKATAARMIGEEARTYALGLLATANALGDLLSSVLTGWLLDHAGRAFAYGAAAAFTGAGFIAMAAFVWTAAKRR